MQCLMSFPKPKLSTSCAALNLLLLSKDDMIASVADAMLGIVNDTILDTLSLIDSDDNEIDN